MTLSSSGSVPHRSKTVTPNLPTFAGAACLGVDTELFFPIQESIDKQTREARQLCADCPIKAACLKTALETGMKGIWGGTTTVERDEIIKDLRRTHKNALRSKRKIAA